MNIPKPSEIRRPAPVAPAPFRMTRHATKRAADMRLTMNQIVLLVHEPEVIAEHDPMSKYHGDGTIMHMRGEHTAVLDPSRRTIVTLLWRWREGWEDHAEDLGEGREVRPDSHLPSRRASTAA